MSELYPCPFCGGKADVRFPLNESREFGSYFIVGCTGCGAVTSGSEVEEMARKNWNCRTKPPEYWEMMRLILDAVANKQCVDSPLGKAFFRLINAKW